MKKIVTIILLIILIIPICINAYEIETENGEYEYSSKIPESGYSYSHTICNGTKLKSENAIFNEETNSIDIKGITEQSNCKFYFNKNGEEIINTYEVKIKVINGTSNEEVKEVDSGENAIFTITNNNGYSNPEVTCTNDQKGTIEINTLTVSNVTNDTTCTVTYKPITYTITYNLDGGSASGNPNSYTVESETITLNNPSKTGYTFTGWTGSNGSTAQTTVTIPKGSTGDKSYTANYNINTYTVNVTVLNGTINDATSKIVNFNGSTTFAVSPSSGYGNPTVTCTNSQVGSISGTTLTVSNVTNNTTCTVTYVELDPILQSVTSNYSGELWAYKDSITKIVIEDTIAEKTGETESWDISEAANKSVMGRIVLNTDGTTYTAYIQGNGKVKANEDSSYLFYGFNYLETIEGLENFDTSNVTNMSDMFYSAGRKATNFNIGDLSNWNTSKVTDMSSMFGSAGRDATTWNIGDLSNWDTSNVTNMSAMFSSAGRDARTWNIGNLSNWNTSKVTDMSSMFYNAGSDATNFNVNLSNWDTSNVTDMISMFSGAGRNATTFELDLSNWDTSKVTDMMLMFSGAGQSATTFELDLSNWDTSNVTRMSSMFSSAGRDATTWNIGDLSNWDTSNVTSMSSMFSSAGRNATTWNIGDLSNWDTSKVTDMHYMFSSAGQSATTFNSIGAISIPDGCNVADFAHYASGFTGNIILEGNVSDYDYMLHSTATKPGSRVNLIYNSTNESLVDELIALYGPSGTSSQGNIYKLSSPADIYKASVTALNGTIGGKTISTVNNGDSATFTVSPSVGYSNGEVTCTNGQKSVLEGTELTVSNMTNDTVCTVEFKSDSSGN